MDILEQRFQKSPSIVSQQIADEVILVPVRHSLGELESIYTLNETGAFAWSLLDGQHTLAQVHQLLLAEYAVDAAQARQDLLELSDQLQQIEAIILV